MTDTGYLSAGSKLKDRYEIVREIGRGGFSVVYEAVDHATSGKPVAVKLLVPPPAVAAVARERLAREVRAVRSISSPYLVPVYDLLEEGPWTFIIMELIRGADLQLQVAENGPLAIDAAVKMGTEVGEVLAAAHKLGILHRDVKPQNILIGEDGWARLTDFGSARLEGQTTLTRTGAFVGTIDYTAPEVLAGARADARSDVYSLGLTMYFALAGKLPERASPHLPIPAYEDGHHPADAASQIPQWLDEVIAHATSSKPERRFPTATRMLDALRQKTIAAAVTTAKIGNPCLLCGAIDPFGLWICAACGGLASEKVADTYILLERPEGRREKKRRLTLLSNALKLPASSALKEAAVGLRPLIRLASTFGHRVVDHLANAGLAARAISTRNSWRMLPRDFYILIATVVLAGTIAGFQTDSSWIPVTLLFAGLLLIGARNSIRKPLLTSNKTSAILPEELHSHNIRVLSQITSRTALTLYADLVAFVQQMYPPEASSNGFSLQKNLEDLLHSYASAAVKLDSLEAALNRMEAQKERHAKMPDGWMDALSACEQARDTLVQRFLEAIALVGNAQSQSILGARGIGDQLSAMSQHLRQELDLRAEVDRKMAEIIIAENV